MIKIDDDDNTILKITRGDSTSGYNNKVCFVSPIMDMTTETLDYQVIQPTDKITFVVHEKKKYRQKEIFRKEYTLKDVGVMSPTKYPDLVLTKEDTKSFPEKNKPTIYWYDIILNDEKTIIGYDEDGPKQLIVYPEAEEE